MKYLKRFNESLEKTFQVPAEFRILIQDIGPNPTAQDIISCWNDCIEDNPIRFYHDGSNKFILEDGEITPEDVFICLNDYLTGDEDMFEGRREKMSRTGNKNTDTKEDKKLQTKQEIMKLLKSRENVEVKEDGANDLKVFLEDEHIIQVMIRDTKITIENKSVKDKKESKKDFDYEEWGKIKSELSNIIKSSK